MVLQDVFLFADTILNNITLRNPDISREQVMQAAQKIRVHEFITSLPGSYDYNVKERGDALVWATPTHCVLRLCRSNPSI
ncbi:MAG: hypothetical protein U0X58_08585 [Flavobacteriaceae bacterium]